MAEQAGRQIEATAPHLRYLGPPETSSSRRDSTTAREIAREHDWMIERALGRLAAIWPEGVETDLLRAEAARVLREVAMTAESTDEIAPLASEQIDRRLTELLAGSEWYREAMIGRARPLCDAWTGALLAGREPTDHLLTSWLRVNDRGLRERFMEVAVVFAVEPAALLPRDEDIHAHLETALMNLPAERRLATALYFQEEITFDEIGRVMAIAPEEAQGLLGRSSIALAGETRLATWPGVGRGHARPAGRQRTCRAHP